MAATLGGKAKARLSMKLTVNTVHKYCWCIRAQDHSEALTARQKFLDKGLTCSSIEELSDGFEFYAEMQGQPVS